MLDEFLGDGEMIKRGSSEAVDSCVVLGRSSMSLGKIDFNLITSKFKIPPQSFSCIDKVQLQALTAAADAFEKSNIEIDSLEKDKVSVISTSCLGLDSALGFVERIRHFEFNDSLAFLVNHKNKFPKVTEDTGVGVLNNVIAGRVCNMFDFRGKNFNVDSDFNSFAVALNIAIQELLEEGGLIVLLSCEEKLNKEEVIVEREKITCLILSTLGLAKEKNYPIREIIKKIDYYE